jgi:phage terminase small subunit|tara:strand:- start:265 stop:855 length:591 start_codon:yes stop_codon:yes gene_type:complete
MPRVKKDPVAQKARLDKLKDRKLTRRQELFVKELVSNDGQITMREAAINAGYPASSAHVRAAEMTNALICPHVVAAIKSFRDELDAKYGINFQRHMRDLQKIRDQAIQNGAYSAAVQAEYRRGQAHGDIYVSKSEIRHGSIDQMSKEEVVKALEEMRKSYESSIIDVTPVGGSYEEEDEHDGEQLLQADSGSGKED